MAKELPITEFDLRTVDESTQMFKAMIPFLDCQLLCPRIAGFPGERL